MLDNKQNNFVLSNKKKVSVSVYFVCFVWIHLVSFKDFTKTGTVSREKKITVKERLTEEDKKSVWY